MGQLILADVWLSVAVQDLQQEADIERKRAAIGRRLWAWMTDE